jgi:hypothetical protein
MSKPIESLGRPIFTTKQYAEYRAGHAAFDSRAPDFANPSAGSFVRNGREDTGWRAHAPGSPRRSRRKERPVGLGEPSVGGRTGAARSAGFTRQRHYLGRKSLKGVIPARTVCVLNFRIMSSFSRTESSFSSAAERALRTGSPAAVDIRDEHRRHNNQFSRRI